MRTAAPARLPPTNPPDHTTETPHAQTHTHTQTGKGAMQDGANGDDMEIRVPAGTIIRLKDASEDEPPLAELLKPGERALLLVGGRGGRGNLSFKTGKNTAPAFAEKGEGGQEKYIDLELKVRAPVGAGGRCGCWVATLCAWESLPVGMQAHVRMQARACRLVHAGSCMQARACMLVHTGSCMQTQLACSHAHASSRPIRPLHTPPCAALVQP